MEKKRGKDLCRVESGGGPAYPAGVTGLCIAGQVTPPNTVRAQGCMGHGPCASHSRGAVGKLHLLRLRALRKIAGLRNAGSISNAT